MADAEKLARRIYALERTTAGLARTQQIARSSVTVTEAGEDESGEPVAETRDVPLGDVLVGAVDAAEDVASQGEDLALLDESTTQTVEDTADLLDSDELRADDNHDTFLEVIDNMAAVIEARDAAEAAAEAAASAQTTADGKNSRRRGKTEPVAPEGGWAQGDQWVVENDAGKPVELRVWNGTAWVRDQTLADEILVLGEDGTVRIGDGKVTSPSMAADVFEGKTFRGGTFTGGLLQGSIFELLGVSGTQTLLSDSGTAGNIGKWGFSSGYPAALDNSDGHNSAPCIRTTNTNSTEGYIGIWVRQNSEIANFTPSTDVVASLWVKVPAAATAQLSYGTIGSAPMPLPANTWTQLSVSIPKGTAPGWLVVDITGATLPYALADDFTVTGNVYAATSILINRLADGTPGLRVLDDQGRVITTIDPSGFVSRGPLGGSPRARLSGGQLEFDNQNGLGALLSLGPGGLKSASAGVPITIGHDAAGLGSDINLYVGGSNNRINLQGRVVAPHLPFAMAAGGYASVTVAVGGVGKQTVNYPAGRFTISPLVTGSVSNGIRDVTFSTENRSATSFVAVLGAAGSTVSRTVEFHWQAIQMTPTTAGG